MEFRAEPARETRRKVFKTAGRNLTRNRAEEAQGFFTEHVQTLEVHSRGGDYAGFCKHLKGVDVKGGGRTGRSIRVSVTRKVARSET